MTFSKLDASSLMLAVGCNVAICLALATPDRLRYIRFYLISQESDVNKLGEGFWVTQNH